MYTEFYFVLDNARNSLCKCVSPSKSFTIPLLTSDTASINLYRNLPTVIPDHQSRLVDGIRSHSFGILLIRVSRSLHPVASNCGSSEKMFAGCPLGFCVLFELFNPLGWLHRLGWLHFSVPIAIAYDWTPLSFGLLVSVESPSGCASQRAIACSSPSLWLTPLLVQAILNSLVISVGI